MISAELKVTGSSGKYTTIDGLVRELEGEIKRGSKASIDAAAKVVYDSIVEIIREEGLVASGDYLGSISISNMLSSTEFFTKTVSSSSQYALTIEEGRKAGSRMPPVDRIYNWMINKGMNPSYEGAYAIAQKIAQNGIPPKRIFERGLERADTKMDAAIQVAINKEIT